MRTRGIGDFDAHGVGVGHRLVRSRLEGETQVLLFGDFERIANAFVVGRHAKQACDKGLVGAVSAIGMGKAAV